MVAIKTADVDAFVARPDPARPIVLVFGPDAGLVRERVNALIKASVDDPNDPFALARLEAEELASEPSRLVEEAQTIALFGGRRAVWAKAGSRNIAPAVEPLLALRSCECRVVIEAGDLRRNAPLRALCERAKNATALPCYADSERDRARLIDEEMRAAGLTLAPDARALLDLLERQAKAAADREAAARELAQKETEAARLQQEQAKSERSAEEASARERQLTEKIAAAEAERRKLARRRTVGVVVAQAHDDHRRNIAR